MNELKWWMHFYYAIRYGTWACGYEHYVGKPSFKFSHSYYDGWRNVLHIGKFWIECDY